MSVYSVIKQISNESSTFRSHWNSYNSKKHYTAKKRTKKSANTINSINHVLASPMAVFISFITTDNDSARVIACLIHRDNHLIKHGNLSLISLFGKVYVF